MKPATAWQSPRGIVASSGLLSLVYQIVCSATIGNAVCGFPQEPGSLRASAHSLTAIHNLAVPLTGADDNFDWLTALADHYPRLSTLGLALEGPADWFAERRSLTEAEAVVRALPTTLMQLELDLPSLRPSGCTVKVRS